MDLPPALTNACRQGRLLILWGALPFSLAERPPSNRALALKRWAEAAETLSPVELALHQLPPLPILSLDPSERVERAFQALGVPLQVLRSRHDVPAAPSTGSGWAQHTLLKLAGDLPSRQGVVLSRAELHDLRADPDKRHVLDEARRRTQGGALLLLTPAPASADFRAWWSVLAPAFRDAAIFAAGRPDAPWPEGVTCLGTDWDALAAALGEAQPPPEPEAPETPATVEDRYVINYYGPVYGPVVGDEPRVEQHFAAPTRTIEGDWKTLIAQVSARLEGLSAQLGQGVADLKRGQATLYRQVDQAYRDDLARILVAVQQGRLEQGEMQRAMDAIRRAMRAVMARGLPMDDELRAAVADLTEAVESSLRLERKLELTLPLVPLLLDYKIELGVESEVDLHDVWETLRRRARGPKGSKSNKRKEG
jgi:hypothetical protein